MSMKLILLFLFAEVLVGCSEQLNIDAIVKTYKGKKAIESQNFSVAQGHFLESLDQQPLRFENHINLGISFELLGQNEKALQSYQMAEKFAEKPFDQFIASFNQAEAHGKLKKIDEALSWYQKALGIHADSKEVKVNIELLLEQQKQNQQSQDQQKNGDQQKKKDDGQQKKPEDGKDKGDQDENKDQQKKQYDKAKKYEPRPFKGDLPEADVKKILGELKNQEQKIRSEYNRKDMKERPRDKDW